MSHFIPVPVTYNVTLPEFPGSLGFKYLSKVHQEGALKDFGF